MPTTIKIKNSHIEVNGRWVDMTMRIEKIEKISAGRWEGFSSCGDKFSIVGGREAGGGSREWFVHFPLGYGDQHMPVASAADAVRAINDV